MKSVACRLTLIVAVDASVTTMPKYFDLEISLLEIEPRIWRRFLIHSQATFMDLHDAVQQAFG